MKGYELIEARERLQLTRAELAQILGVGRTTIFRWEERPNQHIDPLHRQFCLHVIGVSEAKRPELYGLRLRESLRLGATFALYQLLAMSFDDWSPDD